MASIAISILPDGHDLDAPMDGRFGRAARFLLWDTEARQVQAVLDNEAIHASHGAGPAAAQLLGQHGVQAVISGRFGPKAHDTLAALGIEMWCAPEGLTAEQALALLEEGSLQRP